ncbi:MAG TPA: hypothetical protein VES40_02705 [Ilumatobacteraceae bacterium]|nr:hypothetical protein [Ilumatobacteraceae bacterium]
MTAIAQRRSRRTIAAATVALGLVIAAAVLVTVGVVTLSNSQEGEAVGVDTRPVETFPNTPNALLAVTDDEGQLASLVVMTLLPEGQGGSIVTVPVNADATSGFGLQRRPLNEVFDPADPEGFVASVEDMLSITIERSAVVDPAGLEALLEPLGPVQAVLPDAVIDTDAIDAGTQVVTTTIPDNTVPDGSVPDGGESQIVGDNGVVVSAGPQILETAQVVDVLTAIDESVPADDQHLLDVAMWSAIAQLAPITVPPEPVTTDDQGYPTPPETVDDLAASLFDGAVGVRDIAVSPSNAATNPTDADVVVLDRSDSVLVFAQISPSLVSTPNTGSKVRIEVPFTDDQLTQTDGLYETNSDIAREVVGVVLFLQGNVVSVDTEATGAPDLTLVEVSDPALLEEATNTAELLYGPAEVRLASTVLEGVDVVVTLGQSYLERAVAIAASSSGASGIEPDESTPADTVEGDG